MKSESKPKKILLLHRPKLSHIGQECEKRLTFSDFAKNTQTDYPGGFFFSNGPNIQCHLKSDLDFGNPVPTIYSIHSDEFKWINGWNLLVG